MILATFLDKPGSDAAVQRHGFTVAGWIAATDGSPFKSIYVASGLDVIGKTCVFYSRPDVNAFLGIDAAIKTGFLVTCVVPNRMRAQANIPISIIAVEESGTETSFEERTVQFSVHDYRSHGHGYMLDETFTQVIPREGVYASGPPAPDASAEVVEILTRYLEPDSTVLDVGCGIGAFGRVFRERGLPWVGCEVRPDFVEAACAIGLDSRLVVGDQLPFDDASFDAVFANEVLEHVREPHPFLKEIRRVAPSAAYFSVPNFEAIPVTSSFYALPWHMLEPDHWNFYARGSLRAILSQYYDHVEVFEYGELPLLRAVDGLPIYNHLFAVARSG